MADWEQFIQHPLTQMGAGIMVGADPDREGLGGVGFGIMQANKALMARQQAEQARRQRAQSLYSKTPTYIRDAEGNLKIIQLSSFGQPYETELPAGYEAIRPYTSEDLGYGLARTPYGEPLPEYVIPKGLAPGEQPAVKRKQAEEAAIGRTAGTDKQTAANLLGPALIDSERALSRLQEMRTHPGMVAATGASSWLPVIRGTERAEFETMMDMATGGAFLQAYQMLKGGGQITEIEGKKAEQAINRMNRALSEEAFFRALDDYAESIQDGIRKLQTRAGVEVTGVPIPWRAQAQPVAPAAQAAPSARANRQRGRAARQERRRRVDEIMQGGTP